MPEYLSPGVYVEEFESGGRPLEGVSTSTAGFIGLAERGAVEGLPELVTSFADYQRKFGVYLSENAFGEYRFLPYAVEHFFINGGGRCYVMRVAPSDARPAANANDVLTITAKNPGAWGDKVRVALVSSSKAKTQIYEVVEDGKYRVKSSAGFNPGDVVAFNDGETKQYSQVVSAQDNVVALAGNLDGDVVDAELLPAKTLSTCEFSIQVTYKEEAEIYNNLSLNVAAANFVEKVIPRSNLIRISCAPLKAAGDEEAGAIKPPFELISGIKEGDVSFVMSLTGGSDGSVSSITAADYMGEDRGPGKRTGIQSFIDNDEVSIMAIPGVTIPSVQLALVAHCENSASRFAVLDIPQEKKKVTDVETHRNIFDTTYAAMYHPWLQVFDPLEKRNIYIPPSGSMIGVYSRSDQTRGVHKAPANEVVRSCLGLDCQYNKGEQDILNPKGVNLIRYFTGQGIRVWGARTCTSNTLWKYINVRRLFIFLEESIKRGTNWVVFEPNDDKLWARVHRTIDAFLTRVWRDGALMGTSAGEAFYIKVDRSTMTQDDIDNGRLICIIGVAPVKPAEFVIFRITQKTSEQ